MEKRIYSFRVALDCDIYITGSNARLLSGKLATYLAGRYVGFPDAATQCFHKYLLAEGLPFFPTLDMRRSLPDNILLFFSTPFSLKIL